MPWIHLWKPSCGSWLIAQRELRKPRPRIGCWKKNWRKLAPSLLRPSNTLIRLHKLYEKPRRNIYPKSTRYIRLVIKPMEDLAGGVRRGKAPLHFHGIQGTDRRSAWIASTTTQGQVCNRTSVFRARSIL